jgi:hypothetical protein
LGFVASLLISGGFAAATTSDSYSDSATFINSKLVAAAEQAFSL